MIGASIKEGRLHEPAHVILYERKPVGIDEVDLGECDDAAFDPEQGADVEVLARLGHDPFVGGNDEKNHVDAGGAGHHVLDEFLVARHIDDSEGIAVFEGKGSKAQFDRDPPLLLLLQPVRVHAGEGLDERSLPVIDMTCRAQNNVLHEIRSCFPSLCA